MSHLNGFTGYGVRVNGNQFDNIQRIGMAQACCGAYSCTLLQWPKGKFLYVMRISTNWDGFLLIFKNFLDFLCILGWGKPFGSYMVRRRREHPYHLQAPALQLANLRSIRIWRVLFEVGQIHVQWRMSNAHRHSIWLDGPFRWYNCMISKRINGISQPLTYDIWHISTGYISSSARKMASLFSLSPTNGTLIFITSQRNFQIKNVSKRRKVETIK